MVNQNGDAELDALEVIDFEKKGNAIKLFLGKNGPQTGDDWDDRHYEYNAGQVDPEYVKGEIDLFIPFNFDVVEPADSAINSPYCKEDFKVKKSWCVWIEDTRWGVCEKLAPVPIFFGDTLAEVKAKRKPYHAFFVKPL